MPSDKGLNQREPKQAGFSPENQKSSIPFRELRIAPVLLGPQAGGGAVNRNPQTAPSHRQVFWLLDLSTAGAFPGFTPVAVAGFVPNHSGGTATDLHRLPL